MAVPSQPANHLRDNSFPPALHQSHGHVQQRVANHYDDQQGVHREGVPQAQPIGNVDMEGQMRYPHHINAPIYNPAHYYPPPLPYPEAPYIHMNRDIGAAHAPPIHAQAFAQQEVQQNHAGQFGYGVQFPGADPPEPFPDVWPHPAPLAPENGLRNLAIRYLNNPNTRVTVVRIEPSPGGGFEARIALELADIIF